MQKQLRHLDLINTRLKRVAKYTKTTNYANTLNNTDTDLQDAFCYTLLQPGAKRIRPILCLTLGEHFKANLEEHILPVAAAIELIHTASLILDDLPCMDNAAERRGLPAHHVVFGESTTILTSISLLARAFGVINSALYLTPTQKMFISCELDKAVGMNGMVKGQFMDIGGKETQIRTKREEINKYKTSSLFRAAGVCAMYAAGNVPYVNFLAIERKLETLGDILQMVDDLADRQEDRRT